VGDLRAAGANEPDVPAVLPTVQINRSAARPFENAPTRKYLGLCNTGSAMGS